MASIKISVTMLLLALTIQSCAVNKPSTSQFNSPIPFNATLVQTMPVSCEDNNVCLEQGGYYAIMPAQDFTSKVKSLSAVDDNKIGKEKINIIGIGATKGLGDEITYAGHKIYKIYSDDKSIKTTDLNPKELISFSQAGIIDGLSDNAFEYDLAKISAESNNKIDVHEINHNKNSVFSKILKEVAKLENASSDQPRKSYLIEITAKATYVKVRAVNSMIEQTNKKSDRAFDLMTHITGGYIIYDQNNKFVASISNAKIAKDKSWLEKITKYQNSGYKILNIKAQSIKEIDLAKKKITMYGIITGSDFTKNKLLQGLHLHYSGGHILDLGTIYDVKMKIRGFKNAVILSPDHKKCPKNQTANCDQYGSWKNVDLTII
jgi:hypothetical protein